MKFLDLSYGGNARETVKQLKVMILLNINIH